MIGVCGKDHLPSAWGIGKGQPQRISDSRVIQDLEVRADSTNGEKR